MKQKLTDKQAGVLAFIKSFFKANGYAPSRREIADNFKWDSANAAQVNVVALERKGYIKSDSRAHRNIVIL